MSVAIATSPPATVTAGDKVDFTVSPGEFTSSGGYSPVFVFRSDDGSRRYVVNGTDYGSDFRITAASDVTRTWAACFGQFTVFTQLSDGTDRRTLIAGRMEIRPDPASTDTVDLRSSNRRILDAITARIEGRASSDIQSISISGQSIARMSLDELIRAQTIFRAKVDAEEIKADTTGRKARGRIIAPRFPL